MKMGLLTAPFGRPRSMEVADWAATEGFEMLEVCAWPQGEGVARRYGGVTHVDVEDLSETRASEIVDELANRGITISGLGYYPNPLHPDPEHAETVNDHLKKVITAAEMLEVPVVNTFIGADGSKTQADNWADAKKVWPEIVEPCRRPRGAHRHRELPDDLLTRRVALRAQPRPHPEHVAHDVRGVRRDGRAQLRSVPPRLADDRYRGGGRRVRRPLLSPPRQGPRDRPSRVSTRTGSSPPGSAGRCPGFPGWATSPGSGCSPPSTAPATTTSVASSTRTGSGRARTTW